MRQFSKILALIILPIFFLSCVSQDAENQDKTLASKDNRLNGIWKSIGYGYILKIEQGKATFYDITEKYCLKNPYMSHEHSYQQLLDMVEMAGKNKLLHPWENFPIEFNRITKIPSLCQRSYLLETDNSKSNVDPIDIFNVYWQTFAEQFAYSEEIHWDWNAKYNEWREKIHGNMSNEELLKILDQIMEQVRDGHSIIFNADGDELIKSKFPRKAAYKQKLRAEFEAHDEYSSFRSFYWNNYRKWKQVLGSYLESPYIPHSVDEDIMLAKLESNLSYLRIDEMGGYVHGSNDSQVAAVNSVMTTAIKGFNASNGLVIDLRLNGGGHDDITKTWLSYLINEELITGIKQTKVHNGFSKPRKITVPPIDGERYLGPIVVLISEETASAAESFLQGLRARGNVTFVGENSFGALSTMLFKALPNGWSFSLSNHKYMAHDGTSYEFSGFPVDYNYEFRSSKQIEQGRDLALEKAIELLR
jgi:carboxyl-terminal processing protease